MYYENDREKEIIKYLPLVEKVVNGLTIKRSEYDRGDLYNIGVIGLMDALEKFDKTKKVPFEGYAYIRIKGTIIDEVRKTAPVSRTRLTRLNEYYRAKENLEKSLMRTPSELEICEELEINEKQLSKIHETVHQLASVSLEKAMFSDDGNETELINFLEDKQVNDTEDILTDKERQALLSVHIDKLSQREQIILNMYYVDELSLKHIAYVFDISVPRVSQIHGKIILKLRESMRREYDD
ncbi:MAG: FliA/WhiG family RNA polymerase sigma factor [Carnobacterium sp.]|nr:FliA/WhiG family RNA polymerase sigma factor [Carnobacterium sp.]